MKKIIAFFASLVLCLTLMVVPVMAEEYPEEGFDFEAYEAQERLNGTLKLSRWSYTAATSQDISIESKEATACADVTGYKNIVTKIVMYMYIQQLNNGSWNTLKSGRYEFDSWHALKEITYSPCPHGYTYRLKTSYYVYSGTEYEYISGYSPNFVYY